MAKKHEIKLVLLGILSVLVLVFIIWVAQNKKIDLLASENNAASLSVSPANGQLRVGEEMTSEIIVDGQNLKATAVETILSYDPQLVNIVDQDPNKAGTQLVAGELFPNYYANSVDPEKGLIYLSAAILPGGQPIAINEPRIFGQIKFIPLRATDSAKFDFIFNKNATNESNVFESNKDNQAVDVLQGVLGADYHF